MDDLPETYASERLKTLAVWNHFTEADLAWRPPDAEARGRSVREQFVHQCLSESKWFATMLGIDAGRAPLPADESKAALLAHYAGLSAAWNTALAGKPAEWWTGEVMFFDVRRSRLWVVMRRLLHTAHHRGQLTAYLRCLGRPVWSTFGPTADTGGLAPDGACTVYAWPDEAAILAGKPPAALPPVPERALSERPG